MQKRQLLTNKNRGKMMCGAYMVAKHGPPRKKKLEAMKMWV